MSATVINPTSRAGIGPWEPLWLGEPARHLYAGFHRGAVAGSGLGVLLAPPMFHEQPRSRCLLAQVASELAALGLPCLRFEFFGTGDSAGESGQMDFDSMCTDLGVAASALRAKADVDRVAVLAWRGAALPVSRWLRGTDAAATSRAPVILWEPVLNGAQWLQELERADAAERGSVDRYLSSRFLSKPPTSLGLNGTPADTQLMGIDISPRLRRDIAGADLRLDETLDDTCVWALLRPDMPPPPVALQRVFALPGDSPTFGASTRMDAGLFVTPGLKRVADELGRALLEMH